MMLLYLLIVEIDKLKMLIQLMDDYYLIIVFQFYRNTLYFLRYDELEDPKRQKKQAVSAISVRLKCDTR
jgi:hypothetical protein